MLQRHSGEYGFGIDNWAALMIDGANYTIIPREGHHGSVGKDGQFVAERKGTPGAWTMEISSSGELKRTLVPTTGKVSDILKKANYITPSNMLEVTRKMNPDDGKESTNPWSS